MSVPAEFAEAFNATPWAELRKRFRKDWDYKRGRPAAGVYRLYDSSGGLLYVGLGSDPYYRWKDHARKRAWWAEVDHARTTVEWFWTYREAMDAETAAIRMEDPLHNRKDSKRRLHWTQERYHPDAREIDDGSSMLVRDLGDRMTDVLIAVSALRRTVFVAKPDRRWAALVPVEVGDLVLQLGTDETAAILSAYIAGTLTGEQAA